MRSVRHTVPLEHRVVERSGLDIYMSILGRAEVEVRLLLLAVFAQVGRGAVGGLVAGDADGAAD